MGPAFGTLKRLPQHICGFANRVPFEGLLGESYLLFSPPLIWSGGFAA